MACATLRDLHEKCAAENARAARDVTQPGRRSTSSSFDEPKFCVLYVVRTEDFDLSTLHLNDRDVASLIHAVRAEFDRTVECHDVGRCKCIAHFFLVDQTGTLDSIAKDDHRSRARCVN